DLRCAREASWEPLVLRLLRRDQLERDRPSEPRVEGSVHDAHAAAPQYRFNLVACKLVAGAQLFARRDGGQVASVGRRIREGNLVSGTDARSTSSRIHTRTASRRTMTGR